MATQRTATSRKSKATSKNTSIKAAAAPADESTSTEAPAAPADESTSTEAAAAPAEKGYPYPQYSKADEERIRRQYEGNRLPYCQRCFKRRSVDAEGNLNCCPEPDIVYP